LILDTCHNTRSFTAIRKLHAKLNYIIEDGYLLIEQFGIPLTAVPATKGQVHCRRRVVTAPATSLGGHPASCRDRLASVGCGPLSGNRTWRSRIFVTLIASILALLLNALFITIITTVIIVIP